MAQVLKFQAPPRDQAAGVEPASPAGGQLVAMAHVNLDTVVETVRVIRELDKIGLLDQFNGRGHAARLARARRGRK